jgi:hypothetical protein
MDMEQFTAYARDKAVERPDLRDQIIDLWQLARDEIEDGESETGEIEKALQDIDELMASGRTG